MHALVVDFALLAALVEDSVEFELTIATQNNGVFAVARYARLFYVCELLRNERAHSNSNSYSTVWLCLFLHILNNSMSFWQRLCCQEADEPTRRPASNQRVLFTDDAGGKYTGEQLNHQRNGYGVYTYPNGDQYEG